MAKFNKKIMAVMAAGVVAFSGASVGSVAFLVKQDTAQAIETTETSENGLTNAKYGEGKQQIGNSNTYWEIKGDTLVFSGRGAIPYLTMNEIGWSHSYTQVIFEEGITSIEGCHDYYDPFMDAVYVELPSTLTKIGENAFKGSWKLQSIDIPDSVREIGMRAFDGCYNMVSLRLSKNLMKLGKSAFKGCKALSNNIQIPDSLHNIPENAFYECKKLSGVTLSNNLSSIGKNAFAGCSSLLRIDIPNSVSEIEETAFANCESLQQVSLSSSLTEIGRGVFAGCGLQSVTIPNRVKKIGESAFAYCNSMYELSIPTSIQTIGENAFVGCSLLMEVYIPKQVESIGKQAFAGCESLEKVTFESDDTFSATDTFTGVGYNNKCTLIIPGLKKYNLPNANGEWHGGVFSVVTVGDALTNTNTTPITTTPTNTPDTTPNTTTSTPTTQPTQTTTNTQTNTNSTQNLSTMPISVPTTTPTTPAQTAPETPASNLKGSITIDTANYKMDKQNRYQIGVNIKKDGRRLSGDEVKSLIARGVLKVEDSRTGSIVDMTQLENGDFLVTGKNYGTCYIVYKIMDGNKEVNHASVKVDVEKGVKQGGQATRNTSLFDEKLLSN